VTERAYRVRLSFWGTGVEYLLPTRQDAEHVAHYFREHENRSQDDTYSFLFRTSEGGFVEGLTDPEIEKEIWYAARDGAWQLWDRFTARSRKSTPLPPLSFPPVSERFAFFHAAAACAPTGRGVLLLGPSFSGKSALALKLAFAGWGVLTDDLAVVDPGQMQIRSFRRPLGIRENTFSLVPELEDALAAGTRATKISYGSVSTHMVHASDLGFSWLPDRASLDAVVVLSNDPAHERATLKRSPAHALHEALRENHFAGLASSRLAHVPVWQLDYDLERHCDAARQLLMDQVGEFHG